MTILPVLDLRHGVVVRGVAGRRAEYRPVQSRLSGDPSPLAVARAVGERLGLSEFYVADLDAILDRRPCASTYRDLADAGFSLLIDAGVRTVGEAEAVLACGAAAVVAGLETLPGPCLLEALCRRLGPERVVFSLDLAQGRPLGHLAPWETDDPLTIGLRAADLSVQRLIVLDLAAVGVGSGVPTIPLCRQLLAERPELRLITGGGVRGTPDLVELAAAGIDGVLIASALHDGRIGPEELARFR